MRSRQLFSGPQAITIANWLARSIRVCCRSVQIETGEDFPMKKINPLILVGAVLAFSVICLAFARANDDSDGLQLTATVTSANGSGITGTATVNIGEDGLRGRLKAENLKVGHAYTV